MASAQKKILCIEDDREVAALIVEDLAERGFQVCLAHDDNEGFDTILEQRPDLVLADMNILAISGFELLERLASAMEPCCDIPFIFVTALTDPDNRNHGPRLGADEFITKPIDFEVLHAIISARLVGPRLSKHPHKLRLSLSSVGYCLDQA
jgi:DNA-binding response OmpR family regulator